MKELVIAAYDREYTWINNLKDTKVTIYRKGDNPLQEGEILIKPNVGRDVHTFFYHIINNYDNLSDVTFFSQDYPFDHISNYVEIINNNQDMWDLEAHQKNEGCWFFCTQYGILECNKNGEPHHPGLNIESIWNELFETSCPDVLNFVPTGHFAITKEQAKKIPLSTYKKILNILETDPNSPWVIERLEPYILLR